MNIKYKNLLILIITVCFMVSLQGVVLAAYEQTYQVQYYLYGQETSQGDTTKVLLAPPETFSTDMRIISNDTYISIKYGTNSVVLTRMDNPFSDRPNWRSIDIWEPLWERLFGKERSYPGWHLFEGKDGPKSEYESDGVTIKSKGYSINHFNTASRTITFNNADFNGLIPNSAYSLGSNVSKLYDRGRMGFVGTEQELFDSYRDYCGYFNLKITPYNFNTIDTQTNWANMVLTNWRTFVLYTEARQPILSAADIKDTRITLNWLSNGNPGTTTYVLQRKLGGGAWVDRYTGPLLTFTDTGLANETTYDYRVIAKHVSGVTARDKISDIIKVSTTANPAVAAAQEAASKAEAAKKAAEETLQYSSDAKKAAEKAQQSADTALNQINHSKYGLEALYNKLELSVLPDIKSITSTSNITLAVGQKFEVKINATGIKNNLRYRITCGEFDSGWVDNSIILIEKLYESGPKTAKIYVSNNPYEPDRGAIAEEEFKFFSI